MMTKLIEFEYSHRTTETLMSIKIRQTLGPVIRMHWQIFNLVILHTAIHCFTFINVDYLLLLVMFNNCYTDMTAESRRINLNTKEGIFNVICKRTDRT